MSDIYLLKADEIAAMDGEAKRIYRQAGLGADLVDHSALTHPIVGVKK